MGVLQTWIWGAVIPGWDGAALAACCRALLSHRLQSRAGAGGDAGSMEHLQVCLQRIGDVSGGHILGLQDGLSIGLSPSITALCHRRKPALVGSTNKPHQHLPNQIRVMGWDEEPQNH